MTDDSTTRYYAEWPDRGSTTKRVRKEMTDELAALRAEVSVKTEDERLALAAIDTLRAERDGLRDELTECRGERDHWTIAWQKERDAVECMQPVVKAAIAASDGGGTCTYPGEHCQSPACALEGAIETYQEGRE